MKLSRKQAAFLHEAVAQWRKEGVLPETQAGLLTSTIQVQPFDWRRLAKYSFWVALICIVTAVSSALADRVLVELLERLFEAPHLVKCAGMSVLAAGLYRWGITRRTQYPERSYSNEAILFLGVVATATAIYQLGKALDTGSGHFSLLLLLSSLVYGVIGIAAESNLIWVFALASLGGWMGTETGYVSGWGAYYLGMNYPLRFLLFGGMLTAIAINLETQSLAKRFFRTTLVMGLLYLFIALWIMSIFGNYGDMHAWERAKQIELFHWSLLFGLVACGAVYHGLKYDNGITKGFGLTFLFINLYTRYFEWFWNSLHKAIFFAVLGISFWYLGTRAEKIWNLGRSDSQ